MSNTITTPNMSLVLPVPGQEPGPNYAADQNASFTLVDQHNHTAGSGVSITPAGLNINTDLTFGGNNAVGLRSVRFTSQVSPIATSSDLDCLSVSGVDLYYRDGNGNSIQITAGGLVNATSSGISSGTATASFVGSVLVVNAASLTPANIQGASLLLGNNTASSNYLTLSPPSAMASSFGLVLPSIPATTQFMTLDSAGNMGANIPIAAGITTSNIAALTILGSNIAAQTITQDKLQLRATGSTVAAGGYATSTATTTFTSTATSGSPATVTGLSVTITTTGRPVMIGLQPNPTFNAFISVSSNSNDANMAGHVVFLNGTSTLCDETIASANGGATASTFISLTPSAFIFIDTPTAGTYTYTVKTYVNASSSTVTFFNTLLFAYEL